MEYYILTPSLNESQNPLNSDPFKIFSLVTVWCLTKELVSLRRSSEVNDGWRPIIISMYGCSLITGTVDKQIWGPKFAFTLNFKKCDEIGKYI